MITWAGLGWGRVPDLLVCAAETAEQLWNAEVENDLKPAIKAARDGRLHDNDAHVAVIRDGIALHLLRSLRYLEINRAAVAQSIAFRYSSDHTRIQATSPSATPPASPCP